MNTFSAFRSVAIHQFLHPKTRRLPLKPLPRGTLRAFHVTTIRRSSLKAEDYFTKKASEKERKAQEAKSREIGLRGPKIPYDRVRVRFQGGLSDFRPLSDVLEEVKARNAEEIERVKEIEETGRVRDTVEIELAKDTEETEQAKDTSQTKQAKVTKEKPSPSSSSYRIKTRYEVELVKNDPFPIVAIINSKAEFEKKKRTQEKTKASSVHNVTKEIQLTWSSSAADVENRLEKMKDDLQKGYKVDLAISPKKHVPPPRREEMQERIQELVSQLAGFAREWREAEYTRTTAVAYLRGIVVPSGPIQVDAKRIPKGVLLKQERKQKEEERQRRKLEREAELKAAAPKSY